MFTRFPNFDDIFSRTVGPWVWTDIDVATNPDDEQVVVKDDVVTIHIPVPGFKKNELSIRVDEKDKILIVSGEISSVDAKSRFVAKSFERKFRLQQHHCYERITSKLEDGILTIEVPIWKEKKFQGKTLKDIAIE